MNAGYRVREKRFTTPLDLGLCITSDSYKSKQKTGFGEKEQNKQTNKPANIYIHFFFFF